MEPDDGSTDGPDLMDRPEDPQDGMPFGEFLQRLARKFAAAEARELEELAIGATQRAVLEIVAFDPGLSQCVVAERLAIDKAAVSRAVDRLVLNCYVTRVVGERDRRRRELYITPSGERACQVARPGDLSPEARLVAGLPSDDLRHLRRLLTRLDANLDVAASVLLRLRTRGTLRRAGDDD